MARKKAKPKRGPKPDSLKLEGDWRDAVNKAIKKKRPKDGWPTFDKNPKKDQI